MLTEELFIALIKEKFSTTEFQKQISEFPWGKNINSQEDQYQLEEAYELTLCIFLLTYIRGADFFSPIAKQALLETFTIAKSLPELNELLKHKRLFLIDLLKNRMTQYKELLAAIAPSNIESVDASITHREQRKKRELESLDDPDEPVGKKRELDSLDDSDELVGKKRAIISVLATSTPIKFSLDDRIESFADQSNGCYVHLFKHSSRQPAQVSAASAIPPSTKPVPRASSLLESPVSVAHSPTEQQPNLSSVSSSIYDKPMEEELDILASGMLSPSFFLQKREDESPSLFDPLHEDQDDWRYDY